MIMEIDYQLVYAAIYQANRSRKSWALALDDDIVQEAALKVLAMFQRNYDPAKGKPSTFLFRSAQLALMGLAGTVKKQKAKQLVQAINYEVDRPAPDASDYVGSNLDDLDRPLVVQTMLENMECLEPNTRQVLLGVFIQGKTLKQVARTLKITEARASHLKNDGLTQLKFLLSGFIFDAFQGE